jgi:uncharacterized membrane protein YccC
LLEGELDEYIASIFGAVFVLVVGSIWRRRKLRQHQKPIESAS